MAKSTENSTTPATETTEPKRRGRPASFPGQETVAVLTHVPDDTRDQMRALAEDKGERLNQTIARIIAAEFKRLKARQAKRAAKAQPQADASTDDN